MMRPPFRVFVTASVGLIIAICVRTLMWAGPSLYYRVTQPSIRSECASIRPGMTFSDVDAFIHSGTSPGDESLSVGRLAFGSNGDMCQVDLDPATHKVLKTEFADGPGGVE
jgi:hypothetical protein